MTIVQSTAALYAAIIALVILFQICLIAGAPWGRFTQGGRYAGPLPSSGRFVAAVSIVVLIFLGASLTSAAGLTPHWASWTGYAAVAVQALSTSLNWVTPSKSERRLWGPITTVMLLVAVYVVLAA